MEATVWLLTQRTVFSILSGFGLMWHIILLIPLIKHYKSHFSKPFYTICISLAFADMCNLMFSIINGITDPLLFDSPSATFVRWKGFLGRVFWFSTTFHQFLIALERSSVVLCPPGSKLILTKTKIYIGLALVWTASILCNVCILTDYCPYIQYPNTTQLFYDFSLEGAHLQNQVVDLGLQFVVIGATVSLSALAGLKVRWVRKKVHAAKSLTSRGQQKAAPLKRNRLENLLLLQSIFASLPHTIVIILYHTAIYIPGYYVASDALSFVYDTVAVIGFGLNPVLHLIMNKDLSMKTQETLCCGSRFDKMADAQTAAPIISITYPISRSRFKLDENHNRLNI